MRVSKWQLVLLFSIVSFLFNIWVRFIYVDVVQGVEAYKWHNELMINNVDGYTWMEGARDIIAGFHQENDLSSVDTPAAKLLAFVSKMFGIALDRIAFYIPGILGALLVVPLVLIGVLLENVWVGFLAALLAPMAWSYYHRTMFGYLDTDMLVIVLPTFAVWAVMYGLVKKRWYIVAPLVEIVMIHWHTGLTHVANGIFIMSFVYLLYLKSFKKEDVFAGSLFLLYLLVPLLPFGFWLKIALLISLEVVRRVKKEFFERYHTHALWIVGALYFVFIGTPWLYHIAQNAYFTRAKTELAKAFHYYDVVNTVREAGRIDWDVFVHRISGSWAGFFIGLVGYFWLIVRYPAFIVSLPMVVLGFFALRGGLRFTIFAVPFFALGNAYVAYMVASFVAKYFKEKIASYVKYALSFAIMVGFIYPNYAHIHHYIMPTTFNKEEVKVLDTLKRIAKREDYVLSWWDYGYPIRYYADVKTLIDGGKHSGDVNYPVSFALTRPQLPSRNMAVLDVYFTEKDYKEQKPFDIAKQIMEYYGLKDVHEIENLLAQKVELPKIKEDIYYFVPLRMLDIFPTVAIFSLIDLETGQIKQHFFYQARNFKDMGSTIALGAFVLDKRGFLRFNNQQVPIKNFDIVSLRQDDKIVKRHQTIHPQGLNVIYMQSYGRWLVIDDFYYNSTYIQLFVLDNYDKELFEPVIVSPYAKVFKVVK